ncbi:GNAT family protein [Streptomyces sp. BE147]|uniref:GNAT family N-acetyltransferase n=1 Tax=Streptomyces sp. BE147 TaxID=3002524 RepID=UPI002E76697C|nr:GNAT family protein [Streptomyces sp. BE147]MEE1736224.1 GNAT family protein [Streptomyces sp. BE147]
MYAACLDGELVGIGELKVRNLAHRQGEISYLVHPRVWGRGVGTVIGRELLSRGFGLIGLHRIYATCDPRNVASARVLGKLGMTHEGRHRHTALIRDGWRDSEVFSILDQEWAHRRTRRSGHRAWRSAGTGGSQLCRLGRFFWITPAGAGCQCGVGESWA